MSKDVDELIGTLKNTMEVSQFDPLGSSEDDEVYESSSCEQSLPSLEDTSPNLSEEKKRLMEKKLKEKAAVRGKEVDVFIKKHPSFKIKNLIDHFEMVDLMENGLNIPKFHLDYHFPEYPRLPTGIDLVAVPHTNVKILKKACRELIALDDETLFEISNGLNVRVFGVRSFSFKLKEKADRVRKVGKSIFMFFKDFLIIYDAVRLQKWDVRATDATGNSLGEVITLEEGRYLRVYKDDEVIHRVDLSVDAETIVCWYDRRVIVRTVHKLLFILDLNTLDVEIISGPPDEKADLMEILRDVLVIKTPNRVYFIDLKNYTKALARIPKEFKISVGDVVRTYDYFGKFRYFDLVNPRNNFSEKYKEPIRTFDSLNDKVYLIIDDVIRVYKSGELVNELDASTNPRHAYDFSNVIFTEDDFEKWKEMYKKVEKEEGEFIPNELNMCLKADVDRILGREKVQQLNFQSQKLGVSSQKKKKKGGF